MTREDLHRMVDELTDEQVLIALEGIRQLLDPKLREDFNRRLERLENMVRELEKDSKPD